MIRQPLAESIDTELGNQELELIKDLKRDGFVYFRNIFPIELVNQACNEIKELYRIDKEQRVTNNIDQTIYESACGKSILTKPSHLLINIFKKSEAFDQLFEILLTNQISSKVIRELAGENIKLRGYNVRLMTGEKDPHPIENNSTFMPHEWHRDSLGEICFGIFLTDVEGFGNAATAMLPGSHKLPYDPRYNCIFGENTYKGLKFFIKNNIVNRLLGKKLFKNATGAYGKRGDAYIFLNDVWHGREPNLYGEKSMVALVGAFPTDFPFPDKVDLPATEIIDSLPPAIQKCVKQDQEINLQKDTIIHEMIKDRKPYKTFDLFHLALLERRFTEIISAPFKPIEFCFNSVSRAWTKLGNKKANSKKV